MGVALIGVEGPGLLALDPVDDGPHGGDGIAGVADTGVGHMRLEQQIGDDVAAQGLDRGAHDQGLAIGVREDALLDLEAAVPVSGHHAIGR